MTMFAQFDPAVVFTKEEYEEWYIKNKAPPSRSDEYESWYRKTKTLEKDLRSLLNIRGVPQKYSLKAKIKDLENYIFNSIPRKTAHATIIALYKNLVQHLPFNFVLNYADEQRPNREYYNENIAGIILSDSTDERKKVTRNLMMGTVGIYREALIQTYIDFGKLTLDSEKRNPFDDKMCSCALSWMDDILTCPCCLHKIMAVANEYIIELGEPLFRKRFHNIFLFSQSNELFADIFNYIGIFAVYL